MNSTDPATINSLQHLGEARRVPASAQTMLRASAAAAPDIDDLMETGNLVATATAQLAEVDIRTIGAALPRYWPFS